MIRKSTHTRKPVRRRHALDIIARITGEDDDLREMIAQEGINAEVAKMIYEARTRAGLSQKELADLVGTKQPVIARLENGDYQGHSLSMLQRIAIALHKSLEVRLVALKRRRA